MEGEEVEKASKTMEAIRKPVKPQLKKHMSSTFTPMIGDYMSNDDLNHHVDHQLSLEQKKYVPEEEPITEEQEKSKKRKVKFKKNKNIPVSSDEEDEKEAKRREYREGLRDRMLEDLELLRDYYKRIYKRALKEKVSSQHREFKTRDAEALARERQLKEKEEKDRHRVVIRLPKSQVLNDQSYKEDIQETVYHKIIKLEHHLKKQGYLCKVFEIKAFWDFILVPGNLDMVLKKGKFSWEDILEYEKAHCDVLMSNSKEPQQKWSNSNVNKMIADNARPSWHSSRHRRSNLFTPSALTDIASSQSGREQSPVTSFPSKQKSVSKAQASGALTLEQKFPKVEFPPLAAYSLVFGEQEPDPEEIERELEIQRKEEAKHDTRSKLLTMFSHALANRAATQRLMEKNEEYSFNQLVDTSSVKELMYQEIKRKPKLPLTIESLQAHERRSAPRPIKKNVGAKKSRSKKLVRSPSPEDDTSDSGRKMMSYQEYQRLPPMAVPLSLHVLEQTHQVKEAKGLSTLWVNPF